MIPIETQDAVQTLSMMVIDLKDYVHLLNGQYGHLYRDPVPGIYLTDGLYPIVTYDMEVYRASEYQSQKRFNIEEFETLEEPLLDKNGMVLIPRWTIQNKRFFLTQEPKKTIQGFFIATLLCKWYISNMVHHPLCSVDIDREIYQYFHPQIESGLSIAEISHICRPLLDLIDQFVGYHLWNIYIIENKDTLLHVSRCTDYRIVDWMYKMSSNTWTMDTH